MTKYSKKDSFLHKIVIMFDLDKPLIFVALNVAWISIAGIVNVLIIGKYFPINLQGYYFTFFSISAIRAIAEMGFSNVLIQFSSHEFSKIRFVTKGRIEGDIKSKEKIVALGYFSLKWYILVGFGAVIMMWGVGIFVFETKESVTDLWFNPWLFYCVLILPEFLLTPIWAILEGGGQISQVYIGKILQGIISYLASWAAIIHGANLWMLPVFISSSFVTGFVYLIWKYNYYVRDVFYCKKTDVIEIRKELWKMQWRVAVSYIFGYFVFNLFVPTTFYYKGAKLAGQLGMTLAINNSIVSFSTVWLTSKIPKFGHIVASGNSAELDKIFFRTLKIVIFCGLCMSIIFIGFIILLDILDVYLASRILPIQSATGFIIANFVLISVSPFVAYVRAHKKELIMNLSIYNGLVVGTFTLICGKYFTVDAMGLIYFIANSVTAFFIYKIWINFRSDYCFVSK